MEKCRTHEQSTVSYSPTPHGRDPAAARARAVTLLLALAWSHPPNSPVCSSLFLPGNAFRHPVGLLGSRLGRAPTPPQELSALHPRTGAVQSAVLRCLSASALACTLHPLTRAARVKSSGRRAERTGGRGRREGGFRPRRRNRRTLGSPLFTTASKLKLQNRHHWVSPEV